MSFLDLDTLPEHQLVAQYVIEQRAMGQFLDYGDYQFIEKWVAAMGSAGSLLLILSDLLPAFYSNSKGDRRRPRSLKFLDRKVMKRVQEMHFRAVDMD